LFFGGIGGLGVEPIIFISVDFPEPDAPIIATYSPSAIDKLMSLRTGTVISPSYYSTMLLWQFPQLPQTRPAELIFPLTFSSSTSVLLKLPLGDIITPNHVL
jgi:hypothetical protein